MGTKIEQLTRRIAGIGHLHRAMAVLEWDLQTYMPHGGAAARAEQMGHLSGLAHEQFTADETRRLLDGAEEEARTLAPDSDDARLVACARRDFDHAARIPSDLAAELAQHAAISQEIWRRARDQDDFAAFAPSLARTIELSRRVADLLGYEAEPYDALLDQYEPQMTTAEVAAVFEGLRPRLVDLARGVAASLGTEADDPPEGCFPAPAQSAFTLRVVEALGYDLNRGRQDVAPHPFCTEFSRDDVRITTRFDEQRLDSALFSSIHETGHALYEQGIPQGYDNTPLGAAASMGWHESQSRMWENLVGRSRAFAEWLWPQLREAFPDQLPGWDAERFYRGVNRVRPSLIRVEADEVTYNLHTLLRFDLEREMLNGEVGVDALPAAWNDRMEHLLGIRPPNDALGVLQDVHWSGGMLGYFPTYTLGNLIAAQLWHVIRRAILDLDDRIQHGDVAPLLDWLRQHVHRHGRKYLPRELVQIATGEPLSAHYLLDYLEGKYRALYGIS